MRGNINLLIQLKKKHTNNRHDQLIKDGYTFKRCHNCDQYIKGNSEIYFLKIHGVWSDDVI